MSIHVADASGCWRSEKRDCSLYGGLAAETRGMQEKSRGVQENAEK
jgi:hypothetical protein